MKLFMSVGFGDGKITIKIYSDNDDYIVLRGKQSYDHQPIFGCELNEGEQDKLLAFLLENK